ncbi:hypothetical protein FOA52_015973 [Chlamydomonas sp. UWO 241]|nr:hypothetical protein FOA52_015973 [Chlamydomonas sp. UWO 241]
MHALFDFVNPGLLGSRSSFGKTYSKLITAGQDRTASERERAKGAAVANELRRVIAPFFLCRLKKDVLTQRSRSGDDEGQQGGGGGGGGGGSSRGASSDTAGGGQQGGQTISRKNDLVVWLRLTDLQAQIYKGFLQSDDVKKALNQTQSPLAALTVLKKVCDHPALLSTRAASAVIGGDHKWAKQHAKEHGTKHKGATQKTRAGYDAGDDFIVDDEDEEGAEDEESLGTSPSPPACAGSDDSGSDDDATVAARSGGGARVGGGGARMGGGTRGGTSWLVGSGFEGTLVEEIERNGLAASCKSAFIVALLAQLQETGHCTLVFSQSRVMLDIIEAGVRAMGMPLCRIDGTMGNPADRQAEVRRFQAPGADIPVFLLTSQVGGLGLTLTAADRVIIVDPNWNPSIDNQSVDRAYRIGQARDVVVYRLITCGTVEEKIYRKQVFKGGLSRAGTEQGAQFRYFALSDLRDLFTVKEESLLSSDTQRQLHTLHAAQRQQSEELGKHLAWLRNLDGFAGVSDHDLLFTVPVDGEVVPSAEEGRRVLNELNQLGESGGGGGGGKGGADELSAMMANGLSIGGAHRPLSAAERAKASRAQQAAKVTELEAAMARQRGLLTALGSTLGDGGSRIRAKIAELEGVLGVEKRILDAGGAGAGGSSGGGAGGTQHPPPVVDLADSPALSAGWGGGVAAQLHEHARSGPPPRWPGPAAAGSLGDDDVVTLVGARANSGAQGQGQQQGQQPGTGAPAPARKGLNIVFGRGRAAAAAGVPSLQEQQAQQHAQQQAQQHAQQQAQLQAQQQAQQQQQRSPSDSADAAGSWGQQQQQPAHSQGAASSRQQAHSPESSAATTAALHSPQPSGVSGASASFVSAVSVSSSGGTPHSGGGGGEVDGPAARAAGSRWGGGGAGAAVKQQAGGGGGSVKPAYVIDLSED